MTFGILIQNLTRDDLAILLVIAQILDNPELSFSQLQFFVIISTSVVLVITSK